MAGRNRQSSGFAGAIAALYGLLPIVVCAQQAVIPLQLSFSDPGARSMGFGGAFVALADDATSAFANPAGLTQLIRPEFSIEGRHWSHTTPYTTGGRVEGLPTGNGLDSIDGLRLANSSHDSAGLSFLSYAYPVGKWSFAAYRHQYADLEFSGATQGLYGGGTDCCQSRLWDNQWTSDMAILSYGLSAAYRIRDDFDIGFGVVYYDASLNARVEEYLWDDDTFEAFYGSNSYLPEQLVRSEDMFVDDSDWSFNVGFLWRPTESWSIGGVYRDAFEVDFGNRVTAGQAIDFGVPPGGVISQVSGFGTEFPDIYGIGVAYRRTDGRLTLSFQWDRVQYSNIPDSLRLDDQTIDDADELHLGGEYVFLDSTPIIALRFGTWYEPDHQMRPIIDDPWLEALTVDGDNEIHYTAGFGLAMERSQFDLAVDISDRVDTVSLSAIFNF
ncbi:MAG: outer membrane protein transport protein [Gammaproteobacteria bacterium]|nr:outer membrane protein transport protein [Gammaproteobacteria bacterium]MDH3431797.1 outer membrane protein transport protein [Gammaproteobacteria bacterium]